MRQPSGRALLWPLAVVAVVAVVVAAVTSPNRWDPPALTELDLGAAGAADADGTWVLEDLVLHGTPVPLVRGTSVVVDLDTTTAVLTADAGCNPLLGSFTLRNSGQASFTIPSARTQPCDAAVRAQEGAVLAALALTSAWEEADGRLILTGQGSRLELRRMEP